ncbi:hypothetical protein H8F18_08690 [Vibrio fluvialis]|uniref:hypothetical protein n=1 Tax=Vibrio TaxID=662 RepID=UPI001560B69A|nr:MULTISPECIES: hypothetical protein [Vibrio]MBL4242560.1 hypothetical protein [Vibrio fluvialis]MBL4251368.1 hypothetical protein [Vibrio fluvialis]MBY7893092.1 hypothetical protein [Vibrio fluvialis]MBY7930467.1 hypothetical protein [Vibrio fluvialis]MBY8098132.1 hypothetical protein [Vibrio fluvialis]
MGQIIRVKCECGVDSLLHIGVGFFDCINSLKGDSTEYRYWALDINSNGLECLTSPHQLNTIPDIISEEDIDQALNDEKKILCISCYKHYFFISEVGVWD